VEVANTVAYLINKSISFSLNYKTLMKVWSGRPAYYENLRVFGALAFAHVKKEKLEAWVERCIFIICVKGVKGYKLWMLE